MRWFLVYFAVIFNFQNTVFIWNYPMLFITMLGRLRCYLKTPITIHLLTWRPSSLLAAVGETNCCVSSTKVLPYSRAHGAFHNLSKVSLSRSFCMTGQRSSMAFESAVEPTHFNPYMTLKRQFSPLVGGEYSLSDVRNLYSRLIVPPQNLSG